MREIENKRTDIVLMMSNRLVSPVRACSFTSGFRSLQPRTFADGCAGTTRSTKSVSLDLPSAFQLSGEPLVQDGSSPRPGYHHHQRRRGFTQDNQSVNLNLLMPSSRTAPGPSQRQKDLGSVTKQESTYLVLEPINPEASHLHR